MACDPGSNYPVVQFVPAVTEVPVSSHQCVSMEDVVFFYSNRPERITGINGVLWYDSRGFGMGQYSVRYYCYLWHVNSSEYTQWIGLTLQNHDLANTLFVNSAQGQMFSNEEENPLPQSFPQPPFERYEATAVGGKCIAQAQLYGGLEGASLKTGSVAPGSTETLFEWGPVSPGKGYGVYLEFTLSSAGGLGSWTLREAFSSLGFFNLPELNQAPVELQPTMTGDGRGSWLTNRVEVSAPVLDLGDTATGHTIRLAADRDLGPDACWPAQQSNHPLEAWGNKGKYGCLYLTGLGYPGIRLGWRVLTNLGGTIRLYVTPRGGNFFGAAVVRRPSTSVEAKGIPSLAPGESALLAEHQIQPGSYGAPDAFLVGIAVAGEAATPFTISLVWEPGS